MKYNLKLLLIAVFLIGNTIVAQKTYFRINGDKPVGEKIYKLVKEGLEKQGKIEELLLRTKTSNDSVINYMKLQTLIEMSDGSIFDPYLEVKKHIGTTFKIEKFKNHKNENFASDYLGGKPTIVNFWFTTCVPCLDEMPLLNDLKEKYGEKVNFIAITFNDKKTVANFLKKKTFNFEHITDAKNQINELKINSYPASFIIDKEGTIKFVFGDITYDVEDVNIILEGLLEQ